MENVCRVLGKIFHPSKSKQHWFFFTHVILQAYLQVYLPHTNIKTLKYLLKLHFGKFHKKFFYKLKSGLSIFKALCCFFPRKILQLSTDSGTRISTISVTMSGWENVSDILSQLQKVSQLLFGVIDPWLFQTDTCSHLSACIHRCGLAAQISDVKQLCLTLGDVTVPLPSEVKAIGSETDRVLPLEELACRVLHAAHNWTSKCHKQTYDNCIRFLHI